MLRSDDRSPYSAPALLDLELHEPLGGVSGELAHNFVLRPLLNQLGGATAIACCSQSA